MKTGWVLLMGTALSWPLPAQERAMPGVGAPAAPIVFPLTAPSYSSGMIGLGVGQAMRVVATNVGVAPPVASAVAIPACGVDVKIFDSNGKQVGSDNRTDSLASQASFAAEQAGPTSDRAEYRAQIQIVLPNATSNTGGLLSRLMVCNIVWTIQVYDTQTKKTDFVVTGNPIAMGYIPVPLCQTGTVCPATTTGAPVAALQAAARKKRLSSSEVVPSPAGRGLQESRGSNGSGADPRRFATSGPALAGQTSIDAGLLSPDVIETSQTVLKRAERGLPQRGVGRPYQETRGARPCTRRSRARLVLNC